MQSVLVGTEVCLMVPRVSVSVSVTLRLKIMLINSARVYAVGSDALNVPYSSHTLNESCIVPAVRGV
jgi:hypothetical protein